MMRNFTHLVKMANVNVMKMMKKRQTRKKKKGGDDSKLKDNIDDLLDYVKLDPLYSLSIVKDGYFNELLQEYMIHIPSINRNYLSVLQNLKTTIPMSLSRQFIASYKDSFDALYPKVFASQLDRFLKQPMIAIKMDASKKFIKSRRLEPTKTTTIKKLREQQQQQERGDQKTILPYQGSLPQRNIYVPSVEVPDRAKIQLINRYLTAPWMVNFVDKPVVGIAMRELEPRYFTTNIVAFEDIDGNRWYKVNKLWASMSANRNRSFIPDKIAYILRDQSIVIENEDMYNASLTFSPMYNAIEDDPVSPLNFDIVKNILMNNSVIKFTNPDPIQREQFVEDIIQSTGPAKINLDLADKIGHVLLVLDPYVTKTKRIFLRKLAAQAVKPSELVKVNYATAFLEWYASDLDLNDINTLLDAKKKAYRTNILRAFETSQPGYRRRPMLVNPNVSDVAPFFQEE